METNDNFKDSFLKSSKRFFKIEKMIEKNFEKIKKIELEIENLMNEKKELVNGIKSSISSD